MDKCKICFFVPYYPHIKGGAEYQSKIIAEALSRDGRFDIFYISGGHMEESYFEEGDFRVYALKINSGLVERASLYGEYLGKVKAILEKERPSLVYQRILNTFTYRLSLISKRLKIPLVLHIADNYSLEFSQGYWKSWLKRRMVKSILKQAPHIVCQTAYQASLLEKIGYRAALIMPNIHPYLKISGVSKNKEMILWVGNSRPVKQLELFLNLAKELAHTKFDFHIIGTLPESDYGRWLDNQIRELNNVIYHGSKDNEFINGMLQEAALLVNTSISEGFPNTFIQSWLCGTPVLALNADPLGLIDKWGIGFNCKGDSNLLTHGVNSVLLAADYEQISSRSIKLGREHFSIEKQIPAFIELLKSLQNG